MDKPLNERLAAMLAAGDSKEQIYQRLLADGDRVDDIALAWHAAARRVGVDSPAVREADALGRRTIAIVEVVSVVLLAVGVFSFVASKWSAMADGAKVAALVVAMLLSHALGWRLRIHGHLPMVGEAVTGLGTVMFGAVIFLVGQVYDLRVLQVDGYVLWLLGALATALSLDSLIQMGLAVAVGAIAILGTTSSLTGTAAGDPALSMTVALLATATVIAGWSAWRLCR